jgi:hypothetical protein
MIADRAYSPNSLSFMDRRASLFYFAAAVPAVGFVHGPADVNPLNEAMLESYAEGCFMNHGGETRYGRLPGGLAWFAVRIDSSSSASR